MQGDAFQKNAAETYGHATVQVDSPFEALRNACSHPQETHTENTFRILVMKHYRRLSEVEVMDIFWELIRQLIICRHYFLLVKFSQAYTNCTLRRISFIAISVLGTSHGRWSVISLSLLYSTWSWLRRSVTRRLQVAIVLGWHHGSERVRIWLHTYAESRLRIYLLCRLLACGRLSRIQIAC